MAETQKEEKIEIKSFYGEDSIPRVSSIVDT